MSSLTHTHYAASSRALGDISLPSKVINALVAAFREWRERSRLINELSALDDRELADISLPRSDIGLLAKGHNVPAVERRLRR